MNKLRRRTLTKICDEIAVLRDILEEVKEEEEEYRDNMPENLQYSERYDIAQEACDNLYYALSSIEEALDYIECAKA